MGGGGEGIDYYSSLCFYLYLRDVLALRRGGSAFRSIFIPLVPPPLFFLNLYRTCLHKCNEFFLEFSKLFAVFPSFNLFHPNNFPAYSFSLSRCLFLSIYKFLPIEYRFSSIHILRLYIYVCVCVY